MQQNINERIAEKKHQINVWRAQLNALMHENESISMLYANVLRVTKCDNEIMFAVNRNGKSVIFDPELPFNEDHFDEFEDTIVKIINDLKDKIAFGE